MILNSDTLKFLPSKRFPTWADQTWKDPTTKARWEVGLFTPFYALHENLNSVLVVESD